VNPRITGSILLACFLPAVSWALSPALPAVYVNACLQLEPQPKPELTPDSRKTLQAFLDLITPALDKTQSVSVKLERLWPTNKNEAPFLSPPPGEYFTTTKTDPDGRKHKIESHPALGRPTPAQLKLVETLLSPTLLQAKSFDFTETRTTDTPKCAVELQAVTVLPPLPILENRFFTCTTAGCKESTAR
jgi:hypothetical protein